MTVTQTPPPPPSSFSQQPQGSYTPPAGAPPQAQKSGSGCWKALAIGCSVVIVLGAAALVGLFIFVFSVIKRTDVYREAYHRASSDPRVIAALGTPIEKGWWVFGSVRMDNDSGNANFNFPISGPKGNARVHVVASFNGNWTYTRLVVKPDNGGDIDVLQP
ncbi:MAG: cytochrome c oxidase assembly factor Coa1 family protein [Thermoanaerobaculia bacterium]